MAMVYVPRRLVREVRERGVDLQSAVVEALAERLKLDPSVNAEAHLELAERFLSEGLSLIDRDPVQASEKLYKAMEECVKAVALILGLHGVLARAGERWTVTDLERAVREASRRLGRGFMEAWDSANYLHVWGFHEARLDGEAVRVRAPVIAAAVEAAKRLLVGGGAH